jgi:hypothetical protein
MNWFVENQEFVRNYAITVGVFISTLTFIFSARQQWVQNRIKRYEKYVELEKTFDEDETFVRLINLLENDDPELNKLKIEDKYQYLGFIEHVAIAVSNRIITEDVAFNMFGYYAIRAHDSANFAKVGCDKIDFDSIYWRIFKQFVQRMKEVEADLTQNPKSKRKSVKL